MDLQVAAQEKLSALIENGTVDAILEKRLTSTLESVVADIFKDYSEFGKDLKKVLSEKMAVNLNELKLDRYSSLVMQSIEKILVGTALEGTLANIQNHVKSLVETLDKKTWKLSEIIQKYMDGQISETSDAVYCAGEPSYNSIWLEIGEKRETRSHGSSKQEYEIRMLIDEKTGVVHNVWYKGNSLSVLQVDKAYMFEAFLIQLWASQCTIEIDDDQADYECTRYKG